MSDQSNNPYETPDAEIEVPYSAEEYQFVGFWWRVLASIIDSIIVFIISAPFLFMTESPTLVLSITYLIPLVFYIWFWHKKGATPGKTAIGARIINLETGGELSIGKSILRYIGMLVSTFTLLLGFIMVGFTKRKQGLHDLIAGTAVIKVN